MARRSLAPIARSGPAWTDILWAAATLLAMGLAALGIFFFPGLPSLTLGLGATLFGLALTLWRLLRPALADRRRLPARVLSAALFLAASAGVLGWLRSELLFGYKAVDDRLSPILVRGDHYFADRHFFRQGPIARGEVMVFRDARGKVAAGRVAQLPGEELRQGQQRMTLAADEYGLQRDLAGESELVPRARIEARALVIYGSYDPASARLIWQRSGRAVRQ